jgi:hypothetical protein
MLAFKAVEEILNIINRRRFTCSDLMQPMAFLARVRFASMTGYRANRCFEIMMGRPTPYLWGYAG